MLLEQKDLETVERIIYKNGDDVAVSIARSFERLEDRIDAVESRIYSRVSDIEDKIESLKQDLADELNDVKSELRDFVRIRERSEYE